MRNTVALICKAAAIILFVLVFMFIIILGSASDVNYNSGSSIPVLISAFLFCLLIFALGEIIELLDHIRANTYELSDMKMREKWDEKRGISPLNKSSERDWRCTECGAKNSEQLIQCKSCGKYR